MVKGSDVDLSGALIGKVMTGPQPVPGTQQVAVEVKLNESVKIRKSARYSIESSGIIHAKLDFGKERWKALLVE